MYKVHQTTVKKRHGYWLVSQWATLTSGRDVRISTTGKTPQDAAQKAEDFLLAQEASEHA